MSDRCTPPPPPFPPPLSPLFLFLSAATVWVVPGPNRLHPIQKEEEPRARLPMLKASKSVRKERLRDGSTMERTVPRLQRSGKGNIA